MHERRILWDNRGLTISATPNITADDDGCRIFFPVQRNERGPTLPELVAILTPLAVAYPTYTLEEVESDVDGHQLDWYNPQAAL